MGAYKANFICDFMSRTFDNQKIIDEKHKQEKEDGIDMTAYEITQRINSLFAFVIMPQEKFNNDLIKPEIDEVIDQIADGLYVEFEELKTIIKESFEKGCYYNSYFGDFADWKDDGWREPEKIYNIDDYEPKHLFNVFRHLRNSIAHGGNNGLQFLPFADPKSDSDSVEDITDIIFFDYNPEYEKCKFCIQIGVDEKSKLGNQLDRLIENLSTLYSKMEMVYNDRHKKNIKKEMKERLDSLKELMNSAQRFKKK